MKWDHESGRERLVSDGLWTWTVSWPYYLQAGGPWPNHLILFCRRFLSVKWSQYYYSIGGCRNKWDHRCRVFRNQTYKKFAVIKMVFTQSVQYRIAIGIITKCRSVWHLFCSFGLQWPFPEGRPSFAQNFHQISHGLFPAFALDHCILCLNDLISAAGDWQGPLPSFPGS